MKYPIMSYMCTYITYILYKLKFALQIYNSMPKAISTSVCTISFFSVPELPFSASHSSVLILMVSRDGVPVKLTPAKTLKDRNNSVKS